MNKLKNALAKAYKSLSDEEKDLIAKHWDVLNEDLREKFKQLDPGDGEEGKDGEEDDEEEEGDGKGKDGDESKETLDEKALTALISKNTKAYTDQKMEAIAQNLVNSFVKNVEGQRAAALATGAPSATKSKEADQVTRDFIHALKAKDVPALKKLAMKEKAIDTSSDGSGADAGFLIPEPLLNEVIRLESVGYGKARQLFGYNLLTEGNTKRVTALGATLSVFWVDEKEAKPASQPAFDVVTLALKKLAVIVPMTEEVVEDSAVNLTELVGQLIREAIDKEVDEQFFDGDGTVWTGIFNDASIPTTELATNITITGLRPEDILAVVDNTPLGVNARWLMHRTVLSKIRTLRQNADGTGDYMYNPIGGGSEDYGTLAGYPVELSEAAPTAAEAATDGNQPILMFGDFQRGVAYGEKSAVRVKILDQATITDVDGTTVINLAEQDMIGIRAVQRVGFKVTQPEAMRRLVTGD